MKNDDLQEIKPVYIHEANYTRKDEINLVDLAVVLVRRKKLISAIIIFSVILGVIAAYLIPIKYTYSTSIAIGSQIINGSVEHFESPQTLLAKIEHSFIPNILNSYYASNPEDKKIHKISASIPTESEIIILETKGTDNQANELMNLLHLIAIQTTEDHKKIYDAVKSNISSLKTQAQNELNSLDTKSVNQIEQKKLLKNIIEVHESQLANLKNTREIASPIRLLEPTSVNNKLIVVIITFIGIIFAIFAALFTEFTAKVKDKIKTGS